MAGQYTHYDGLAKNSTLPDMLNQSSEHGWVVDILTLCGSVTFLRGNTMKKFITAFLLCFAYGVLIEVGQYYIPGRYMSSLDVVANFSGAVIGAVLTLVLHKPVDRILKKLKIR